MTQQTQVATIALVAVALIALATPSEARRSDDPSAGLPSSIKHYEPVAMMSAAAASGTGRRKGALVELAFATLGREFELQLEPSDVYAQGATIVWVDEAGSVVEPAEATGRFYKGRLRDDPESWVRLRLGDGGELAGVVATAAEIYFLEPSQRYFGAAAAGQTLAYRLSDTDSQWAPGSCAAHQRRSFARSGVGHVPHKLGKRFPAAHELFARAAINAVAASAGSLKRAEIALVADYQYFQEHGTSSAVDLAEIMNAVDGIYQAELGVAMQVLTTVVYSAPDDPFTDTTNYNTLLNELSTFHNNNNSPGELLYGADLVHLVTNRDLDSTVIGVAWIDGLCGSYYGTGLSQDYTAALYNMTLLLAHEMGHNFNAPHDNQGGSACASAPGTFIMSPVLSSSLQQKFSDCSKGLIGPAVTAASCFDTINPGPTNTPTNTPPRTPTITATPTRTATRTRTPVPAAIGVPVITAPGAGQLVEVEGVTFVWTAVAGATAYDLRVLNAATQATVFTGSLAGGSSTTTLISLPNNGSFTFRVRACIGAIADASCGAFAARNFSVSKVAPSAAPTITAPGAGAMLISSLTTLTWTTVAPPPSGDLFYEVRLTNVASGQIELQLRTFHPVASTTATLRSAQYQLQVRACEAGCGPYSAPVTFSVALGAVPNTVPTITDATVSGGNSLSATWTAVSGAEWYQLQVVQLPPAGPGGGALTVASRQVFATSATLPVPQGQAYLLVAACNGDGCGSYSGGVEINPSGPNPAAPNIGEPIVDSVVSGPSVLFAWSRIPGDTGSTIYRVYVQDLSRQSAALDVLTTQNYYGALLKAEGSKYAVVVIANPGTPAQIEGPGAAFTVRGLSAVAPTLMAPTHESTVAAGNILMAWSPVPGATLYEYFVAVQGQPAASGRGVTPGTFVQVPLGAVNGQPTVYSGIVRACPAGATCVGGSDAGWSPWSNVAGTGGINFTVLP
jgi:hypothetical protein